LAAYARMKIADWLDVFARFRTRSRPPKNESLRSASAAPHYTLRTTE
jgi:hypothetical protein